MRYLRVVWYRIIIIQIILQKLYKVRLLWSNIRYKNSRTINIQKKKKEDTGFIAFQIGTY